MSITYPLSLPTESGRRQITFRQKTVVAVGRSPFTGQRYVQVHAGQWWEADIVMPPMSRENAEVWVAFLTALNGPEGTMLLGDPANATPRGTAASAPGTPLVRGAGQLGNALTCDGAPAGVDAYLRPGDWVQLGSGSTSRLHKVLTYSFVIAGIFGLDIWPRLRAAPADNAPVTVSNTKGVFSLAPGAAAEWRIDEARHYGISFSVQEVV